MNSENSDSWDSLGSSVERGVAGDCQWPRRERHRRAAPGSFYDGRYRSRLLPIHFTAGTVVVRRTPPRNRKDGNVRRGRCRWGPAVGLSGRTRSSRRSLTGVRRIYRRSAPASLFRSLRASGFSPTGARPLTRSAKTRDPWCAASNATGLLRELVRCTVRWRHADIPLSTVSGSGNRASGKIPERRVGLLPIGAPTVFPPECPGAGRAIPRPVIERRMFPRASCPIPKRVCYIGFSRPPNGGPQH